MRCGVYAERSQRPPPGSPQNCISWLSGHAWTTDLWVRYPWLFCLSQEMEYIQQSGPVEYHIKRGMVPNMRVPGKFYVNDRLRTLLFDELHAATQRGGQGGFLPAIKQISNVAALPGIVRVRPFA